jgi:hypothetical protein
MKFPGAFVVLLNQFLVVQSKLVVHFCLLVKSEAQASHIFLELVLVLSELFLKLFHFILVLHLYFGHDEAGLLVLVGHCFQLNGQPLLFFNHHRHSLAAIFLDGLHLNLLLLDPVLVLFPLMLYLSRLFVYLLQQCFRESVCCLYFLMEGFLLSNVSVYCQLFAPNVVLKGADLFLEHNLSVIKLIDLILFQSQLPFVLLLVFLHQRHQPCLLLLFHLDHKFISFRLLSQPVTHQLVIYFLDVFLTVFVGCQVGCYFVV